LSGISNSESSDESKNYWKHRRQGDVLSVCEIPLLCTSRRSAVRSRMSRWYGWLRRLKASDAGAFQGYETPHGVVIVSQTCDVTLANRPNVLVAAVAELSGSDASSARDGIRPRYVHIPLLGDSAFADLEYIAPISKSHALGLPHTPGIDQENDNEVRRFGLAVARRFGRFPLPDDVVPWISPLRDIVEDKYRRANSGLALALRDIVELRVEAASWQNVPIEIDLHVIVKAGIMPELLDSDSVAVPSDLESWLRRGRRLKQSPGAIANRLYRSELGNGDAPSPVERYHLWLALAQSFADKCQPKGANANNRDVQDAVAGVNPQISSEDEFTLAQIRRSEVLDVDHLSGPYPYS